MLQALQALRAPSILRSVLQALRRLMSNTLTCMAPLCSSWVWINRGTSLRCPAVPLGDIHNQGVQIGNEMVAKPLALLSKDCVVIARWLGMLQYGMCLLFACDTKARSSDLVPHAQTMLLGH